MNFASLRAEAAGIRAAAANAGNKSSPAFVSMLITIAPGAIPKVTTSARLSRSFPMSE